MHLVAPITKHNGSSIAWRSRKRGFLGKFSQCSLEFDISKCQIDLSGSDRAILMSLLLANYPQAMYETPHIRNEVVGVTLRRISNMETEITVAKRDGFSLKLELTNLCILGPCSRPPH